MAGNISLPSWREDQPYAIEGQLAPLIDQPGHPLALSTLNAYRSDRDVASARYHDYVAATNALQAQNIGAGLQEARYKTLGTLAEHMAKPGVSEFMQSQPDLAGLIGPATDVGTAGYFAKLLANATASKDMGQAIGSASQGGVLPAQGEQVQLPGQGYGMPTMFGTGMPSNAQASGMRSTGGTPQVTSNQVPDATAPGGFREMSRAVRTPVGGGGQTPNVPGPVVRSQTGGGPKQPDIPLKPGAAPAQAQPQPQQGAAATPSPDKQDAAVATMLSNLQRAPNGPVIAENIRKGMASGHRPTFNPDGTVTFMGGDGQPLILRQR